MTPLVLRLLWPPPELSPNARVHWGTKKRATEKYRQDCYLVVRETWAQGWIPVCSTAKVVFVVPDKRRRDLDNAMASMKAAWDGLVDAGLLVDDDSKHLKLAAPEMRVVKGQKYVEVTLT
jgi:crossover junction endodeoxyribonuclease RusA